MQREKILKQLDIEYSNIYAFTDVGGDEPLEILDELMERDNLETEAQILLEASIKEEDPQLNDDVLVKLLDIYKEVIDECKWEFDN